MTAAGASDATAIRPGGLNWRRWRLLMIGGVLVGLVVVCAVFADIVAPYSPYDLDVAVMLQGPSAAHWLGTDEVGRDVLSRAIFAARISVEVALVAVGVGLVGGTIIGMGILALARHRSSVGGIGVLALYLQERRGISAGKVQMAADCLIVGAAFFAIPFDKLLLSIASAVALSAVIIANHKPGRYAGY